MQVFYAPDISGISFALDMKESGHCIRVLRMRKGTEVKIIDGKGNLYEGIISEPDPECCKITIVRTVRDFDKRPYHLHIAISPLKNPERLEWFVEKCVEIGIDEITPLICRNSEKRTVREERLNGIIISAMKQSLKALRTRLTAPLSFSDFILKNHGTNRMIAHCNSTINRTCIEEAVVAGSRTVILIGPEGDFSDDEISEAEKQGFVSVHLGDSRLRTETAGIAACHSVYLLNRIRL